MNYGVEEIMHYDILYCIRQQITVPLNIRSRLPVAALEVMPEALPRTAL